VDGTHDSGPREPATPRQVSRRGFIHTAAAAGALAWLVPGGSQVGGAAPPPSGAQLGDDAQPAAADEAPAAGAETTHVHPKRATCLARTADGTLVTSDDLGRLVVTAPGAAPKAFTKVHLEDGQPKKAAYVSVEGKRALTAGYDGEVNVHDLTLPDQGQATPTFKGHRADGKKREVWVAILTPDGKIALSATNDGQILRWDSGAPGKPATHDYKHPAMMAAGPVGGLAFVPPNSNEPTHFLSTCSNGDIHLWEIGNAAAPVQTYSHGNSFAVNAVAVNEAGDRFVSGGFDGTIRVWRIDLKNGGNVPNEAEKKIRGHRHWVWRVALSQDGKRVASAGQDGAVRVWDITGREIQKLGNDHSPGRGGSMGVVFGPNNTVIYTPDNVDRSTVLTEDKI
jgi:WD40 repeat protein